jgi:hypothetical protein
MNGGLRSELVGTAALGVAALAALVLTAARTPVRSDRMDGYRTTRLWVAVVLLQALAPTFPASSPHHCSRSEAFCCGGA